MNLRIFLLFVLLLPFTVSAQIASEEADWQALVALDEGPKTAEVHSREEARSVALAYLAKQESALRGFLQKYPQSSRIVDARLRLARLIATRSDLSEKPTDFDAAIQLLNQTFAMAPQERRADVDFVRIGLIMRRNPMPTDQDREVLVSQVTAFRARYPEDRRIPALITEVATVFDHQPRRKEAMLRDAQALAQTPELRARIEDDLRRITLLGQPVDVHGVTADGVPVDVSRFRGKVILVYFFSSWSAPSIAGLQQIEYLRKIFPRESVEIVGVSLDTTREPLDQLKARGLNWPVIFDGKGWKSPLIRGLSLNAIPTLWILDRKGCLRTLNARTDSEAIVKALLAEK